MLTLITNKVVTDYTKKIDGKISNIARTGLENTILGFTNKVDYDMVDILEDLKYLYISKCYGAEHLDCFTVSEIKQWIDQITNKKC